MPVNGALRFAWIWIPVLAFLFGTLPITEQAVSEWDSDILKATSSEPSPSPSKAVDEWEGEVVK
ncbi:MAG TPA: hypothetical protein VF756_15135 [Thermoanaerobaculia bacterium]